MGSPLSPVIANIFMEHFESRALETAPLKPRCWKRFVDDTFVVWPHPKDTLVSFLNHLNSHSPHIQFTMEIEQNNALPFLDVLVTHNDNGSLSHQVYMKKTHTDRYLNARSHHHPSQKLGVLNTLVVRAFRISDQNHLDHEQNHLKHALQNNGYTSSQIQKAFYKAKHSFPKPHLDSQPPNSRAFLPFIQGTTDKIAKILIKKNIKTVFKPLKTLKQSFTSVKDKINPLQQSGVYKIPCSCGTSYIG